MIDSSIKKVEAEIEEISKGVTSLGEHREWQALCSVFSSRLVEGKVGGEGGNMAGKGMSEGLVISLGNCGTLEHLKSAAKKAYGAYEDENVGEILLRDVQKFGEMRKRVADSVGKLLVVAKRKLTEVTLEIEGEIVRLEGTRGDGREGLDGGKAGAAGAGSGVGVKMNPKVYEKVDGTKILKIVKDKLEKGKTKDRGKNIYDTITEDLIKEATDDENLASMFEGWCSWF
ncbi:hypothetical protein TL16_g02214 [Triparma laevis f. inornata]|uniref:FATC domain-containing protein n=1 Tax=Triparma laevis f. inornata TaxID=1714386 RepID=A0A9W6ZTC9_9STRA|nr:hypothetical protein TL16_g02214 [Triparma laevis f. inornata]